MESGPSTSAGSKRGAAKGADQKKMERKEKKRKYWGKNRGPKKERGERKAVYTEASQGNPLFERYYRELGLVPEGEWDAFLAQLKEDLPATFRITGCRSSAVSLLQVLEEKYFKEMQEMEVAGEKVPHPKPLPWYPDRLAWHIPLTRRFIRKSPVLEQFHRFLVNETELGNTSRQEAVSMIPPLLLHVKPCHRVLDMCAAPGSKTAQLIEFLHAEDSEDSPVPSGIVVANDADNRRCYMLVHQAKRLNSPCVMVTNHDASVMPNMYYHTDNGEKAQLLYDRVLCDVPCSGDGTLRKNLTIWRSWSPAQALGLHKIQLRILLRGLEVLSVGGLLAYSTCSLNPVEDEAVIAAALARCNGSVELVDVSESLPQLKRSKGVSSWKVMTKTGDWTASLNAMPPEGQPQVPSTVFPPSEADAAALHLERCIRILPHQQDTGGFFVALLTKTAALPWQKKVAKEGRGEKEVAAGASTEEERGEGSTIDKSIEDKEEGKTEKEMGEEEEEVVTDEMQIEEGKEQAASLPESSKETQQDVPRTGYSKRWRLGYKEDPFVFMREEEAAWQEIKGHYGFDEGFSCEQMLTRSEVGKKRNLYFVSQLVRQLTVMNEPTVKIINIGTKAFARCSYRETACEFRPVQEGIAAVLPFMRRQVTDISRSDLVIFLKEGNPLYTSLSPPTAAKFGGLEIGPCVMVYDPRLHQDPALLDRIALSTWRAAKSARLFVAARERTHLLTVLGEEVPTDLTASVEKATTPGVEGEGKEKGGKGEELEEEAEECTKRARLEEDGQRSNDGPSKGDSVDSEVVTLVDQTSGEDKNDKMAGVEQ